MARLRGQTSLGAVAVLAFFALGSASAMAEDPALTAIKKEIKDNCPNELLIATGMGGVGLVSIIEAGMSTVGPALSTLVFGVIGGLSPQGSATQISAYTQIANDWKDYGDNIHRQWKDLQNPANFIRVKPACRDAYDKLIAYRANASVQIVDSRSDSDLATTRSKGLPVKGAPIDTSEKPTREGANGV